MGRNSVERSHAILERGAVGQRSVAYRTLRVIGWIAQRHESVAVGIIDDGWAGDIQIGCGRRIGHGPTSDVNDSDQNRFTLEHCLHEARALRLHAQVPVDLGVDHLLLPSHAFDFADSQVELVGLPFDVSDGDGEPFAPAARADGPDAQCDFGRIAAAQLRHRWHWIAAGHPHDPGDLAAIEVVLLDRVTGLATRVQTSEAPLEVTVAGQADGFPYGAAFAEANEGGV